MTAAGIAKETLIQVQKKLADALKKQDHPQFITLGQREFDAMESIYDIGKTPANERTIMGLPYKQSTRWTGIRLYQERVKTGGAHNS
tara:strand:+ start:1366 stop:1626 length:261 start_codon:yes stop_codon:yes gene_type:complete